MGKAASESLAVADKVSREKRKDERDTVGVPYSAQHYSACCVRVAMLIM